MELCGVAKSGFAKRIFLVRIGFGEAGDVYFVAVDAIADILQSILSC